MLVGNPSGWGEDEPPAFGNEAESLFLEKAVRFKGQVADSFGEYRDPPVTDHVKNDCHGQECHPEEYTEGAVSRLEWELIQALPPYSPPFIGDAFRKVRSVQQGPVLSLDLVSQNATNCSKAHFRPAVDPRRAASAAPAFNLFA
jgi:hypothetical protein